MVYANIGFALYIKRRVKFVRNSENMKKFVMILIGIMILGLSINIAEAKYKATSPELAAAIKLYKAKNYSASYVALNKIVEKDPSNALAYYYLGMTSAQMGNKQEAINNYSKVITLSPNGRVGLYAKKGKRCLEEASSCRETEEDRDELSKFIYGKYGNGFSEEALKVHEKERIENMKREINREDSIEPQRFKEYRDFSSEVPTNDEIVNAIRTLQKAGINMPMNNGYNSEYAMLTGNYNNNNEYEILNLLMGNKNGSANINPQLIQSMLTSQMSTGF